MIFRFHFLLFLGTAILLNGQSNILKTFRVTDGLPVDIIKDINQDSLGYFWIASDEGLVKFDGQNFTTYKRAFKNKFVKGLMRTQKNELLAVGDLGLVQITNQIDTVKFKTILEGSLNATDSTISYPKKIYQDATGNIWIAEQEAAVKFANNKIRRYPFGKAYNSNNFNKSFTFFEDESKKLYLVAYGGEVFIYDRKTDSFEKLKGSVCGLINNVIYINRHLYIASNLGLYVAQISNNEIINFKKTSFPFGSVSTFGLYPDSSFWIGTLETELVRYENYSQIGSRNFELYSLNRVNSIYLSSDKDCWIATEKGIGLIHKKVFSSPAVRENTRFINSISQNKENNSIYFCDKVTLSKVVKNELGFLEFKHLSTIHDGNFESLTSNSNGLWATNSDKIFLYKEERLAKTFQFFNYGTQIFDITSDSENNIWVAQAKSKFIFKITPRFEIVKFKINEEVQSDFRLVLVGKEGIYASARGNDKQYLFFKPTGKNVFENISIPIPFPHESEFEIIRMVEHNKILWLATSIGLLKFANNKMERVDLGKKFTELSTNCITILDEQNLIISNIYGMIRYNIVSQEYWVYDENLGLPSNTITDQGLFLDINNNLWIGTSNGISTIKKEVLLDHTKTTTPFCISAHINGNSVPYTKGIVALYGSYIDLNFSSISFPQNSILMQYKILGFNSDWVEMDNSEVRISNLNFGVYEVLVRAKKQTGEDWSEPRSVILTVQKPIWLDPKVILLISVGIIGACWIAYLSIAAIINKRRENLRQLVQLKTNDLLVANQELSQKNQELDRFVYSASHDLGAPLKSILGLISIAKTEEKREALTHYHELMEKSVLKLDDFIKEVISYSRNSRTGLTLERLEFKDLVNSALEDLQYSDNYKFISFQIHDNSSKPFVSDSQRIKIILNNLLSNAIKFHVQKENENPYIKVELSESKNGYKIMVEDNGRGIPKQYQSSIFDMFYRASVDVQGSGLGLYILKETVGKLKGTVKIESEINVYTRFTVSLPILK